MGDLFAAPVFSPDRVYRYTLPRVVEESPRVVAFVMLNPSTADETQDDPTIRRCIGFARSWGFGRLIVGNLFAFRATDPRDMRAASAPIGPENDAWLETIASSADLVVCAWGANAFRGDRGAREGHVTWLLRRRADLHAIELAKGDVPKHPLYLRGDLQPVLWRSRRCAA